MFPCNNRKSKKILKFLLQRCLENKFFKVSLYNRSPVIVNNELDTHNGSKFGFTGSHARSMPIES